MPFGGALLGAGLGIAGSLIGGERASDEAMTGYDYAVNSPLHSQYLPAGGQANAQIANLLGVGGDPAAAKAAFDNYLKSVGYQFQLGQGINAINSSAAARGLLNSGATAKALTQYGQNLASTNFNNYLQNLGRLSTQGLQASGQIVGAGTAGGATSAGAIGDAWSTAGGIAGNAATNFFSGLGGGGGYVNSGPGWYGSAGSGLPPVFVTPRVPI